MRWQVLLSPSRRIGSTVATALAVALAALVMAGAGAGVALADSPRQPNESASVAPSAPTSNASTSNAHTANAPTHCSAKPQLQPQPASSGAPVSFAQPVIAAGSRTTASVEGFAAKERVQVVLYDIGGEPQTVTADRKGRAHLDLAVPDSALAGWHSVQFTGWCTGRIAVGRVLVGRVGAGQWPGTTYPGWVSWVALAAGLAVLGSAGLLAVQLWRHRGQEES